ncbi:hypothetical protein N9K16_04785 [Alphaproteobacteria bacterium]|nr:hypothetical protein [Alphaproteobacteria bacterium]
MLQTNLPLMLSSLLGRDVELSEVRARVGEHRLLTLVGPGGNGKTQLAKKAARSLLETFNAGVWFIDLTGVFQPAGVAGMVSRVLGVMEEAEVPLTETLSRHLADREMLLVWTTASRFLLDVLMLPKHY